MEKQQIYIVGDIVRADFPEGTSSRQRVGEIVDIMHSDEGPLLQIKVKGEPSPEWIPASKCILLRGVPLEGALSPNEVAIVKRLRELYTADESIEDLIRVALVHEERGILTKEERRKYVKILKIYREEKRSHYLRLVERLMEIHDNGDI